MTARPLDRGPMPPMGARELAESVAFLIGLGFASIVWVELSDRLRRRILARLNRR